MDRIEIYNEIRHMQLIYILHFVFYIILGAEHILMILKLFWNNIIHKKLFISCSIIDAFFFFYPIIPLALMYKIILKKNLIQIFKILSLIIILLSIAIGIIINIFFWLNLKATSNFYRECPYNLNDTKIFLNEENSSEICKKKRCILESENNLEGNYPYNYICNYNSQYEFEIDPNTKYPITSNDGSTYYLDNYIQCEEKTSLDELFSDKNNINNQNEIYIYLQKCWDNKEIKGFYLCQRYEYHNIYKVKENYKCPKYNYNAILYLSGIFLIILDIIVAFIPWSLDYKSYSKILLVINNQENENLELENNENNQQRRRNNETNTSSNNPNLNSAQSNNNQNGNENNNNQNNNVVNENNRRNNENDYINQPTETIIIAKDRNTSNNMSKSKSSDRLHSGLHSKENSKNNTNSNNTYNNKRKRNNTKENNIGSMISKSESHNMISKTSEKENESEDRKTVDKKLLLNGNDKNNYNEIDDINFNNNIRYDDYKNNIEEDEKDSEDIKIQNNCIIKNKNININKNNNINTKKIKIILHNDDNKENINIKETNNSMNMITQKNNLDYSENNKTNKNNNNAIEQFNQIDENANVNNRNKTPKKDLKSLNFDFSQVLTNIRDSDQITLFNNTNGSIIREERKEDTEKSNKEEEKNQKNISLEEFKKHNLSTMTPFKLKNKSRDKKNKEEKKYNSTINIKNESQCSLLIENSYKSDPQS